MKSSIIAKPKKIKVGLYQSYISFSTLLRREIIRIIRIWPQTLLPPIITMSLYFMIFGNLIGNRIGEMQGFTYVDFIAPGLIMMSIITNSYVNVASTFFSTKFQGNIEEMLVSTMSNNSIILGFVVAGVTRGLVIGMFVTIISLFFTTLHIESYFFVFVVAFCHRNPQPLFYSALLRKSGEHPPAGSCP